MALTDENGMGTTMLVQPSGGNGMGGLFGGDLSIIVLFFLFMMLGGWGNGFGGGNNAVGYDFPWVMNNTNTGFQNAATQTAISGVQNGVTSGFGDLQTALCGGFAGVNAAITNAQMASMERSFAAQTANSNALSGISAQLSQCCCDNRLATVQTQNIVQSEGAATRLAIQTQTQQILDRLCEQEIENLRAQNVSLQNQVNMLNLSASQTAQTAALVADNAAQTQYLINKLTPTV